MKKTIQFIFSALIVFNTLQAQSINAKLGGTTSNETFDVTDSGDNLLFRIQGDGNVGIGTAIPTHLLEVAGNAEGGKAVGHFENTNTASEHGIGVYGSHNNIDERGIGGDFEGGYIGARGTGQSFGLYGIASSLYGKAVKGVASGQAGTGVYGEASSLSGVNAGGIFVANGVQGKGVKGVATSTITNVINYGGYFESNGGIGRGVQGWAVYDGPLTNYGGHFRALGTTGIGVFGSAGNRGADTNYGGQFVAGGQAGIGVHGYATNSSGTNYGVYGKTLSSDGYAGYFEGRGYFSENVGIGTTTPSEKLDVEGSIIASGNVTVGDFFNIVNESQLISEGQTLTPNTSYITIGPAVLAEVTLDATTAIADGTTIGQLLILEGGSQLFGVYIPGNANTILSSYPRRLIGNQTLMLLWNGGNWIELTN